jgi:hypothetical protein
LPDDTFDFVVWRRSVEISGIFFISFCIMVLAGVSQTGMITTYALAYAMWLAVGVMVSLNEPEPVMVHVTRRTQAKPKKKSKPSASRRPETINLGLFEIEMEHYGETVARKGLPEDQVEKDPPQKQVDKNQKTLELG